MTRPMIAHRGRAFEELFARLEAGLRDVFLTARPVYISTSSASGLMEGAVRNAPAGPILSLVNGAFSESLCEDRKGLRTRGGRDRGAVGRDLSTSTTSIAVSARVVMQPSPSCTPRRRPVRSPTCARSPSWRTITARYASWTVSRGVGGAELRFDAWGLDFALTGSQKALALPPGLAFGVASAEFVRRARDATDRGLYFDVVEFEEFAAKNQTPATPALSLLYALDAQLSDVLREGIERRWERHVAMREATAAWLKRAVTRVDLDIAILAPEDSRSPTVTTITLPENLKSADVVSAVARRGFVIGGGYGKLKDTTIRIGHMGDHTLETLRPCLAECEDALRDVGGIKW